MLVTIGILTIGSELLDGRVLDTNAHYLCDELTVAGLNVIGVASCPDRMDLIHCALQAMLENCSHVIICGGLGPTTDDLTREALAEFFKCKLSLDQDALSQIKGIFQKRRREFEPSNEKQALFPEGATVISNSNGTAPGFWLTGLTPNGLEREVCSLPGVPGEMKAMFQQNVLPRLRSLATGNKPIQKLSFKILGLPESVVGARIKALELDEGVVVSYRASFPEIHVIVKFEHGRREAKEIESRVEAAIGSEWIFSRDLPKSFESTVHSLLIERGLTIGTAESCTAGGISSLLTNCPGASAYFLGSLICYSNELKERLLGVSKETIEKFGAVSARTVEAMAKGALERINSDITLAITGIAGPDGGTPDKPVGTFFIGLATKEKYSSHHFFHPGSRARVRTFASYMALDLLRRHLLGISPQSDSPSASDVR